MSDIPTSYTRMRAEQPELLGAYEAFAQACAESGPLDARTVALVKLAISCGAGLEGGAASHGRKALEAGCTPEELLHVAHLCGPTIGFPAMMRARKLMLEIIEKRGGKQREKGAR
jgi:4-carboxymuconolactone decarboxylase